MFPEGAYGLDSPLPNPNTILVNDATIWTSGPKGILKELGYIISKWESKKDCKKYLPYPVEML